MMPSDFYRAMRDVREARGTSSAQDRLNLMTHIMCTLLRDLGYREGIDLYDKMRGEL